MYRLNYIIDRLEPDNCIRKMPTSRSDGRIRTVGSCGYYALHLNMTRADEFESNEKEKKNSRRRLSYYIIVSLISFIPFTVLTQVRPVNNSPGEHTFHVYFSGRVASRRIETFLVFSPGSFMYNIMAATTSVTSAYRSPRCVYNKVQSDLVIFYYIPLLLLRFFSFFLLRFRETSL